MIPSRGGPAPSIHVFTPRVQLRRRAAHHHRTAHLKLAEVPVADGGAWPGSETTHRATDQRPGLTGMEGAGGRARRGPKHQQNPQQEGIPPAVELISYLVPLFFLYRGKRPGNSGGCNPSDRRRLC